MSNRISNRYVDLDLDFLPHPVTKDLRKKIDAEAIKASIITLVLTNFGERPFQPNLAGNVSALLFENATPITAQVLRNSIIDVIKRYETRAEVLDVVVVDRSDQNAFDVSVYFHITNRTEPVVAKIMLQRTR